jgi:hypothetical protein
MRDTNESKPSDEASKTRLATSKPRAHPDLGNSMRDICLLIMRCPVYRRRETHLGSCVELGNLFGDAKGKSSSGDNREAESTNAANRGGLPCSSVEVPVMGMERRGRVTRGGAGRSTGDRRNLSVSAEGGSLHWVARAG